MRTVSSTLVFTGRFKELIGLFFPIFFITFSNYFSLFVEELFFARLSAQVMEMAVNTSIVTKIFQFPCIFLAMMAQVYVGRCHGAKEIKAIGPGIWQFIWFSFLSMFVTLPLSLVYGNYYFKGLPYEEMLLPYYYFMVSINFIYPLATTLICLYLGQGKTRLVLFSTIGFQMVKLTLAYLLIFGWGWIPSLGLMGGAFSTLISQGGFCFLLLWFFLKHSQAYQSWSWQFRPELFWNCIYPGLLRAMGGILIYVCWASIAHLMIVKGGNYNLILSIGSTFFVFLPFVTDAICQSQTSIVSQILGAQNYHLLSKSFRSGFLLALIAVVAFSIPFVMFPTITFHYLFPKVMMEDVMIRNVMLGVWSAFAFYTFSYVPISYILAYKDTKFSLFMGMLNWIDGYLLMYIAIEKLNIAADQFWLVLTLMYVMITIFYYFRMRWLQSKTIALQPNLIT